MAAEKSTTRLSVDEVRHVAMLARLALDDSELATMARQLERILDYVAQIGKLNVDGVEPMARALPIKNVLREDIIEKSLPLEKVLLNAAQTDGAFFKVPKVIGGDEDAAE